MSAERVPVVLPTAVSVEAFDRWVASAEPGATLVYAEGPAIPRHAPAWAHARALVEDQVVTLTSRRSGPTAWQWLAIRRAAPMEAAVAPPVAVVAEDDTSPIERVFRAIRRAASFDRPCPTNAELARLCGLPDPQAASYRVRCLVETRRIAIEQQGPGQPRIATIVGTGRHTARNG